ncbi:HEXXH motif-containing putative peptide modification protein [Streptomyces sp. MJP52]|uniref:aKG-HExxH-type peptide beta-hydroxylase n=1 Tax=Streptomyces sp. MJP52 TaxID=2940555 RepID=UPI00247704C6|nr:HEXXH motif-containing putative peptide modification protein [Streptomyces sp. MJP52]MDH6223668.1 hypothetical protein [Streptomyces sp. MJP52]
MTTLATDLTFEPIRAMQRDRTRRIHSILKPITAEPRGTHSQGDFSPLDYCVSHHVLEGAEDAARAGNKATLDWYGTHPDANAAAASTPTEVGPRLVVAPDVNRLPRSTISETPYYVLGPDTTPAAVPLQDLAAAAYAVGSRHGFGQLLGDHAAALCLLRGKRLGDTLDSWTISRLPGTIYCDHVNDPVVLARDLIHEAGHNWLNDALAAGHCKIGDTASFYSPWKGTHRPAFGFLHACLAFPLTMIYTARVLTKTDGAVHRFLAAYLDQQRLLLAETTGDHQEAVALVREPSLRGLLRSVHREALSL